MSVPCFWAAPASEDDISHVVLNMREASAREAFASRPDDSREGLARDLITVRRLIDAKNQGSPGAWELFVFKGGGVPAALIGAAPGAFVGAAAHMLWLATDDWPAIAIASHRWWHHHFVPEVLSQYRRVEFLGGADEASRRWCQSVGFTPEGIAYRHGKAGEDFVRFAWTNPNWSGAP